MKTTILVAAMLLSLATAAGTVGAELKAPVPITAAGRPLDVEHSGHAAPAVADLDGDGRKDLLLGENYQGRLRIYRNLGTNKQPRFDGYSLLHDGAPQGCSPAG